MARVQDEIEYRSQNPQTHIFFITGNPGLISYYTAFLSSLSKQLNQANGPKSVSIYGKSLLGFQTSKSTTALQEEELDTNPVDLRGQILGVEQSLFAYCLRISQSELTTSAGRNERRPQVILMGHSVGAYILMEIVRRHRGAQNRESRPFDIIAGILLFPTITDIAQSANGQRMGWFLRRTSTPFLLSCLVGCLLWLLPGPLFGWLVKTITRMPEGGARVTEAFLRSDTGVRQALHLARFELNEITLDKWNDDIWQASGTREHTSLYFYFGENDHWVADHTRDKLIETRGSGRGVHMEVDELNIPHGFCIHHSELVAGKVCDTVNKILLG